MEKESYSIDDILSEVKKRREEQEKELRQEEPQPKTEESLADTNDESDSSKEEESFTINEKHEDSLIQQEQSDNEDIVPEDNEEDTQEESVEENPLQENAQEDSENSDMIDILKIAETPDELLFPEEEEKPVKEKFFKTKKGKIVKTVIIILVILIIAAVVVSGIFIYKMISGVADDDGESYKAVEYYDGMDFLQEDFPMIEEQSAYDVYSYKEYLKYWYQNGDPVRSSHVLNILLIGEDTREEEISDTSRADSAIIASINVDTGTIYLTSILRDLYVYYEVNGEGQYGKINETASTGGMTTYINTIERYYKISIDNYAVVNFSSFPKIIDALGGVEVALTNAEVYEVNNNPNRYAKATLPQAQYDQEGNPIKVVLTGEQALAYCRIRKIDSDNARADRQKTVLNELFNEIKNSGKLDAVKVVNQLSQYTKTGYTKKELISIGNLALRDNWLNFNIETTNVPATENSKGGQNFSVSYNNWIWVADIPKDAYELQMKIYGKSNIQLSENRPDYISMAG